MDDGIAQDIWQELDGIGASLKKQVELQEQANDLMRSLIPAVQATAQELLELRKQLAENEEKTVS